MKIIYAIFIFLSTFSYAENYDFPYCSVAITDNFLAPKVNPAAPAFGNSGGLALFKTVTSADFNDPQIWDDLLLFINFDTFSYVYEITDETNYHTFVTSLSPFTNIYLGASMSFFDLMKLDQAEYKIGLLVRPLDLLSLGCIFEAPPDNDLFFRAGIGLRPLFFSDYLKNRVTIAVDSLITLDSISLPMLSLSTELLDGFTLGGVYNFADNTFAINFSFAISYIQTGSNMNFKNIENVEEISGFLNISLKEFPNVFIQNQNKMVEYAPGEKIVEQNREMQVGFFTILGEEKQIYEVLQELKSMAEDDSITGIVIKNNNFQTSFANMIEIYNALKYCKDKGKKIIFYFEVADNLNYAIAAAVADKIYLNPYGGIELIGFAVIQPYIKELLTNIGIEVTSFQSHEYKSANHIFTEKEMPEAEREMLAYVLEGLYSQLLTLINTTREGKYKLTAKELIDKGPYFIAQKALEMGLVDELIYEDELEQRLETLYPDINYVEYAEPNFIETAWSKQSRAQIAIIYATGTIHLGEGNPGQSIGSDTITRAIRKAREDSSISGIILRVDSGGGSALASDIIAREVLLCVKEGIPVVVSMGGTAASGGYYISCMADHIIAQPVTITGSIGVTSLAVNIKELLAKLGITFSTVKTAEHADFGSFNRELSEEEKNIYKEAVAYIYERFIEIVAQGRKMTKEEVDEVAKGRIWTGAQALERGLVDKLGGFNEAIDMIKELAGIEGDVALVVFDGTEVDSFFTIKESNAQILKLNIPEEIDNLLMQIRELKQLSEEGLLFLMPYSFIY